MRILKKKKFQRVLCFYLALNLFFEIVSPTVAFALTSGPAQEEFASFEPASTSDMVDLYSGDFTYNIPLLSVPGPNGGYPINIAYHAGVGMEQEASWVGLGWSLNMGAINRQLRGLPDDFSGEIIQKKQRIKDSWSAGLDIPLNKYKTIAGFPIGSPYSNAIQLYYNSYKGLGYKYSFGAKFPSGGQSINASVGLNLSFDSQKGLDIEPSLSIGLAHKKSGWGAGFEAGVNYSSRQGITSFNFSDHLTWPKSTVKKVGAQGITEQDKSMLSESEQKQVQEKDGKYYYNTGRSGALPTPSSHASFSSSFNVPRINMAMTTTTIPFTLKLGFTATVLPLGFKTKFPGYLGGFYSTTTVKNSGNMSLAAYGYLHDKDKNDNNTVLSDFTRDDIPYSKKVPNLPMSNFTYDLYNQTGQGSGGMFRPYQNGISILNDPQIESDETTVFFDGEVGVESNIPFIQPPFLANIHAAVNGSVGSGSSSTGYWATKFGTSEDYPTTQFGGLRSSYSTGPESEDSYMQMYGEKTGYYVTEDQLSGLSFDDAVKVKLKKEKSDHSFLNRHYKIDASDFLIHNEGETGIALANSNSYKKPSGGRVKRASNIEMVTYRDRKKFSYTYNSQNIPTSYTYVDRVPSVPVIKNIPDAPSNQISEMSILQPDGMRYVYGLPVKNNTQTDYVFAVPSPGSGSIQDQINTTSVSAPSSSTGPTVSDQYESKNTYPSYVNSWLLSYVFSADYVDVKNDGPTEDDYGYWVKFNYGRYFGEVGGNNTNSYRWRMPYSGANYMAASIGETLDDKGSYTYGEKEMFYIESVETKTHIAIFKLEDRHDGIPAAGETAGGISVGSKKLKKLTKISLYTKKDYYVGNTTTVNLYATPIKAVNFEYNYDLCPRVENNDLGSEFKTYTNEDGVSVNRNVNANQGKLTLYKIYFTYQKSDRGSLSPYFFNYGSTNSSSGIPQYTPDQNPIYEKMNMDRWGNYNNNVDHTGGPNGNYSGNSNPYPYNQFPYTPQDSVYYKNCSASADNCASSLSSTKLTPAQWTLKKIFLPTGGILRVNYDFDDYGYVENKRALRMFDVCKVSVGPSPDAAAPLSSCRDASAGTVPISNSSTSDKVFLYFKLERPIKSQTGPSTSPSYQDAEFKKQYLDNLPEDQVFYKTYVHYHNFTFGNNNHSDFLSGYADIDKGTFGLTGPTQLINGVDCYLYGYITLQQVPLAKHNTSGLLVSPIYRSAIETLHANHSDWIYDAVPISATPPTASQQIINLLTAFLGLATDVYTSIAGFNHFAHQKGFVDGINLNGNSIIRLCDPDKKKIGGGVRVKKLELDDNWDNDISSPAKNNTVYGQEYDYTTTDENGKIISSGVAYEPKVGSEESALKTAIKYTNSTLFSSDYHMFVERPIGESYYPGASVGYSKVTVTSIGPNTSYTDYNASAGSSGFHSTEFSAAPVNIYEFYTPKDFPVIFKKPTDKGPYAKPMKITIPILGIFTTTKVRHAQTQGYSIIINDMAGKPKITSSYTARVLQGKDECGNVRAIVKPDLLISRQEFIYNTTKPYNANAVNELDSKVQTISVGSTYNLQYQTAIMGQSHDFFIDMNENNQDHQSFGLKGSVDFQTFDPPLPPAPPMWWALPSYEITNNNLRTVVANKIIYRTGILIKDVNTIQQSTVTNENLAFDIETGQPILTKTNNEFEDPTYSFNYKGHWYYKNLGGSYQNYKVKINSPALDAQRRVTVPKNYFTKGDLVYLDDGSATSGIYHVFSILNSGPNDLLVCIDKSGYYYTGGSPGSSITSIEIVRSGYKNLQHAQVGSEIFKNTKGSVNDFVAYNPIKPVTIQNNPVSINFSDPTKNSILNASAIEFSENWQILEGGITPASTTCVCTLNSIGLDFINFAQTLVGGNTSFIVNYNLPVFTNTSSSNHFAGTYSHGFTQNLISASPDLNNCVTANAGVTIYVTIAVNPAGDFFIFLHTQPITIAPSGAPLDAAAVCSSLSSVGGCYCYEKFSSPVAYGASNAAGTWFNIMNVKKVVHSPADCNSSDALVLDFTYDNGSTPPAFTQATLSADGTTCSSIDFGTSVPPSSVSLNGCYSNLLNCTTTTIPPSTCGIQIGDPINPYQNAMKGIWRPKYSYAYHSARNQNDNVRNDGTFDDFQRFPWENPTARNQKWVRANTVTKVLPHGFEVENVDPIGAFSSAIHGYNFTLPVAVAKNARYNEIGFDGFEDYPLICEDDHFKFPAYSTSVVQGTAHTGKYSLRIQPGMTATISRKVKTIANYALYDNYTVDNTPLVDDNPLSTPPTYGSSNVSHLVNDKDLLGKFAPIENKKYVISGWVHQNQYLNFTNGVLFNFSDPTIIVDYPGCSGCSITFIPSGNIIDGWQRIYGEFTVPSGVTNITVSLYNGSTNNNTAYFDDIRVHPFDASLESYVYDPITLKPIADLDANNYATFYNYDDEGHLIKVKVETKEGIKTVKEGRINTTKSPY